MSPEIWERVNEGPEDVLFFQFRVLLGDPLSWPAAHRGR